MLDTGLGIVIPIVNANIKINDLTCSFDPLRPDSLQIKYKDQTWFSLKILTDIILGLFEPVPMPGLKIEEGENVEFPLVAGESFTIRCKLDLEPIYDWLDNLTKNCNGKGFPDAKDLTKLGKWFVKMMSATNIPDETWDIMANTFNNAMKIFISYLKQDYSSVKSFMDKETYRNLMQQICKERIEKEFNKALNQLVDLMNKIIYEYYTQSLLVEEGIPLSCHPGGVCNLLINGNDIFHLSSDGSYYNIGRCSALVETQEKPIVFNIPNINNLTPEKLKIYKPEWIIKGTINNDHQFHKQFLDNIKTYDVDVDKSVELKTDYKHFDIEPTEIHAKLILPEINTQDQMYTYYVGQKFYQKIPVDVLRYPAEFLTALVKTDGVGKNELPKGLDIYNDVSGLVISGTIEEKYEDLIGDDTTDIIISYPGAEDKEFTITWTMQEAKLHIPDINVAYTVDSDVNRPVINITPFIPEELSGSINLHSFNFVNFVTLDSEGKPTDTINSEISKIFRDQDQFNRSTTINSKWTYTFSANNAMAAPNTLTLLKHGKQVGVKVSYYENGETKYLYGKVIFDITFNQIQQPFSFSAERVPNSCGGTCMEEPWTGEINDTYVCIGKDDFYNLVYFASQTLINGNKDGFYCTWGCDNYSDYEDKTYWYLQFSSFENYHVGAEFSIGINGNHTDNIKVPDNGLLQNSHVYIDCYSFKNPVVSY
jgi:hypothetical protein